MTKSLNDAIQRFVRATVGTLDQVRHEAAEARGKNWDVEQAFNDLQQAAAALDYELGKEPITHE